MTEDSSKKPVDMSGYLSKNVYDGIRIMSPQEVERRRKWLQERFPKLYQMIIEKRNEKAKSSDRRDCGNASGDGGADPSPGA